MSTGFLLTIEYDGSDFSGWQVQPGQRTVQHEIETAVHGIFGRRVRVTGAGRTDRGVHALAQVASFHVDVSITALRLRTALNGVLPKDISIIRVRRVPADFNARYAAQGKIYQYRIWNRPFRSVWAGRNAWHVVNALDIAAMRRAAASLIGRHDFSAFDAAHGTQKDKIVEMQRITIVRRAGFVVVECQADRFLYKMVRNIVGSLAEVGMGKKAPSEVAVILKGGDRRRAGRTAPARGLFMKRVLLSGL